MKLDCFKSKHEALDWITSNVPGCSKREDAEKYLTKNLPLESYYQAQIIKKLREVFPDSFVWKAAAGPYSRGGIPDVCAIVDGRYYGLEVKRPYVGVLSPLQRITMEQIRKAGGVASVVTFPREAINAILENQKEEQKEAYRHEKKL